MYIDNLLEVGAMCYLGILFLEFDHAILVRSGCNQSDPEAVSDQFLREGSSGTDIGSDPMRSKVRPGERSGVA